MRTTGGEEADFAAVSLLQGDKPLSGVYTDADGFFRLPGIKGGRYILRVSSVGFKPLSQELYIHSDTVLNLRISVEVSTLKEVVVTAREATGLTSGNRIDRAAMEHLQPTSFTDLLELLPGNMSKDPDMGTANTITLRETGTVSATGTKVSTTSEDYSITSLGTAFVVDGAPINTDSNLQGVPLTSDTQGANRSTVNRGVDMRSISTDNIESVEVLRGIPSAEYGNLTSGVINIRRIQRATPFTARFKADEYSKLFSAGKGVAFGDNTLNFDAGYLDSKVDPRNNLENFKRITASVRGTFKWQSAYTRTELRAGVDYSGTFDNSKVDPDLNYRKIDQYKSSYNRFAVTSTLKMQFTQTPVLKAAEMTGSVSYEPSRLERHKQVAPQRASVAPTSMEPGVHDGQYLLSEYIADFVTDGKPFTAFLKGRADGTLNFGTWEHSLKAGLEWSMSKNYGRGQLYDLTRPLSAGWTTRPRDFRDIPALHVLSFFAEDNITALLGPDRLEAQIGVRTSQLPALDRRYFLANRLYADPRVNVRYTLRPLTSGARPLRLWAAAGWGMTTKMPTIDYLYPQLHYNDLVQLNYYNPIDPQRLSRISLRTYIEDATNYNLHPARNNKWEVRLGLDWGQNKLSVTYFQEHMKSGYRYSSVYAPYSYTRYDASGIDGTLLTAPPALESLPSQATTVLDGMRYVTNGSRIDKHGIEFQLETERWRALQTRLIVNGAWFRSTYTNSQMLYDPVSDVIGNQAVSDLYVGIYDTNDGRVNSQFNTNFTFDTQIPRWGLVFTTSVQCMWWLKTQRMFQDGTPVSYIATDGKIYPYTAESTQDVMLQHLIRKYNEASFYQQTVPTAVYLNLKATKNIGRWLRISAFVNRIVDYLPDYKSNGVTIRRSADAYFGMELNFTL